MFNLGAWSPLLIMMVTMIYLVSNFGVYWEPWGLEKKKKKLLRLEISLIWRFKCSIAVHVTGKCSLKFELLGKYHDLRIWMNREICSSNLLFICLLKEAWGSLGAMFCLKICISFLLKWNLFVIHGLSLILDGLMELRL